MGPLQHDRLAGCTRSASQSMRGSRGGASRSRLEDFWRSRVKEALDRYRLAAARTRQATGEQQEGYIPSPDGFHAVRVALREESAALRDYMTALGRFTDLILHGKQPPEE